VRYRPLGDVINAVPPADPFEHRIPGCGAGDGRDITVNAAGRALVTRVDC
jgi:hypothetical protein